MPMHTASLKSFLLAALLVPPLTSFGATEVANLRCESRRNPIGMDVASPRLSWHLSGPEGKASQPESKITRGVAQAAYQVLVASPKELLGEGQGDLWDSGKMASDSAVVGDLKWVECWHDSNHQFQSVLAGPVQ